MACDTTGWFCFYFHQSRIQLFPYSQKLTMLYLDGNKIGDNGTQYLADGLRNNTVIIILSPYLLFLSTSRYIDAHDTLPSKQSNRRHRSTTPRRCLAIQHGDSDSIFINHVSNFFHIDRNSPRSFLTGIKSETMGHNILLMVCEITR